MRQVSVYLDNQRIFQADPNQVGWIAEQIIDLSPYLTKGDHTLRIMVFNSSGANLLLAHAPTLDIATGPSWFASADGEHWSPAALASDPMVAPISLRFQRADKATLTVLPFLLLGVCIGWLALRLSRLPPFLPVRAWFGADPAPRVHAMLMIAVGALMLNNVFRLPLNLGFDIDGHYDYLQFIIERLSLPLATDGWQMFQSPLYYLVAAPTYQLLSVFFRAPDGGVPDTDHFDRVWALADRSVLPHAALHVSETSRTTDCRLGIRSIATGQSLDDPLCRQ